MKNFLWFITENDGRTRQVKDGIVTSLSNFHPLNESPFGWEEMSVGWKLDMNRHQIVKTIGTSLGFIGEGYNILVNDFYKFNPDRDLYIQCYELVHEIDDINYKDYYRLIFKSGLNLTTLKDIRSIRKVEVQAKQGGLQELVAANYNTEYFIRFDSDAIKLKNDGTRIKQNAKYIFNNGSLLSNAGGHLVELQKISSEFNTSVGAKSQTREDAVINISGLGVNPNWAIQTGEGVSEFKIKYSFDVTINPLPGVTPVLSNYIFGVIYTDGTNYTNVNLVNYTSDPLTFFRQKHHFEGEKTIQIPKGMNVFFFGSMYPSATLYDIIYENEGGFLELDSSYKFKETIIEMFRPIDLFKKLIEKITGKSIYAESSILQNSSFCISSGNGIRSIPGSGVKTTLANFIKAYDIFHFCALDISDTKVSFESRYLRYPKKPLQLFQIPQIPQINDTITHKFDLIKNLEIEYASDLRFTSLIVGHQEQDVDEINGQFDYNGYLKFISPIVKGEEKEMNLQSPYKAGIFEIENKRINLSDTPTTGDDNDNEVYIIDVDLSVVNSDGTFSVYRDATDIIEGIPFPEDAYNLRLTPRTIMKIHLNWICSILYNYTGKNLKYASESRFGELIINGEKENSDYMLMENENILFKPFYTTFETSGSFDFANKMNNGTVKRIEINYGGLVISGFPISAGIAINTKKEQKFVLILSPESDIDKLAINE